MTVRLRRQSMMVAASVLVCCLPGCSDANRERPLHLEPGVYLGEKSPSLSQAQVKELSDRANLMR